MIDTLLSALYTKLISFLSGLFSAIFGNWQWQVLFNWLPADILTAATGFILVCFGIAMIRILRSIIPF